jgi:hypothetical protein
MVTPSSYSFARFYDVDFQGLKMIKNCVTQYLEWKSQDDRYHSELILYCKFPSNFSKSIIPTQNIRKFDTFEKFAISQSI